MEDMGMKEFKELLEKIALANSLSYYTSSDMYVSTDLPVEEYWLDSIKDDENLVKNIKNKIENKKIKVSGNDLIKIFEMKNMNEKSFLEIFKKSGCKPFNWSKCYFRNWPSLMEEMILFDTERLTIRDIKEASALSIDNINSFINNTFLRKKMNDILNENNITNSTLIKWQFFNMYELGIKFLLKSKKNINHDVIDIIRNIIANNNVKFSVIIDTFMNIETLEEVQRRNIRVLLNKLDRLSMFSNNTLNKERIEFLIMKIFQKNHTEELFDLFSFNDNFVKTITDTMLDNDNIMDYIMSDNKKNIENILLKMIKHKSITYPKLVEITKKYNIKLPYFPEKLAIDTLEGAYIEDVLKFLNNQVAQFVKGMMNKLSLNISFKDLTINIDCDHKDEVNLLLDLQRYKNEEGI